MPGGETSAAAPQAAGYRDAEPFSLTAQGHDLAFYPAGPDRLEALLALIAGAQRTLKLCFYIFAEDDCGRTVRDALVAAARRGVDVALIVDSFGAATDDAFFEDLRAAGGTYCCFSPRWTQRYLIRNHQKMVIADDEIAMIGGFNIEDGYFASPGEDGWNDLALTLRGPAVAALARWYAGLLAWTASERPKWRQVRRLVKQWQPGDGPVQVLVGGPTRGLSSWARSVSRDLMQGERLDMTMAYFSPSNRLLRRIGRIARRGQTRLLMAGKSDNNATIGAARSLYGYLLGKRAKVWEFGASKLHLKLIVLDDAVYLGSANFDMRSLYLNLEIMLRIEDAALAARMREFVSHQIACSQPITPSLHKRRATLLNRVRWNLSWFLVAVVDYTVSRRLNLGL